MKKIITLCFALSSLALVSTSCGSDDDDSSANNNCTTCETTTVGVTVSSEYCDNGDSTMNVSVNGVETLTNQPIPGGNLDAYITALETAGANCN